MALLIGEETPEQVIDRLERELWHVSEQSKTSHRMYIYYKGEYEKAERLRSRMEASLNTWRKKLLGKPKGQSVTETELDLWAQEANTDTTTSDPNIW